MPHDPYTYRCPCGHRHTVPVRATGLVRLWGSTFYAPRYTHTCGCGRTNTVHDGAVLLSLQPGQTVPYHHP